MTTPPRSRPSPLGAWALGFTTLLAGCTGATDDKLGSGHASGTGAPGPVVGQESPSPNRAQQNRLDAGDNTNPSSVPRTEGGKAVTGGLGTASHAVPGETGSRAASPDNTGPK